MNVTSPNEIYAALKTALGLTRGQVRALLPEWWDDAAGKTPDGMWELALLLARRLSLDAAALARGVVRELGAVSQLAYRHNATLRREQLLASSYVASSLAHAVVASLDRPYVAPPSEPAQLFELLKGRYGGIADFDGLLQFCWDCAIPVLPLPNLPVGMRKMDGAALAVGARPAIVIAKKNASKAWLSFILAHEVAHIALGHLGPDSSIVDVSLQQESTFAVDGERSIAQEAQADDYALVALGGSAADAVQRRWSDRASAVELAVNARKAAQPTGCAAGHLILRYAFRTRRWPEAASALRFLHEDFDAQAAAVAAMQKSIDLDRIAEDLQDLICQITGMQRAPV